MPDPSATPSPPLLRLLAEIRRRLPRPPTDYLCLDFETTGVNPYKDHAVQIGLLYVRDGRPQGPPFSQCIRLPPDMAEVPQGALNVHGIGRARLDREGVDAKELYPALHAEIKAWQDGGGLFLGHNIMAFDAPLWEEGLRRMHIDFKFGNDNIVDTGMLVKAMQLGLTPQPADNLRTFYRKLADMRRPGVYWSLDRYCHERFKLERFGCRKEAAHDAGADCAAAHATWLALQDEEVRQRQEVQSGG